MTSGSSAAAKRTASCPSAACPTWDPVLKSADSFCWHRSGASWFYFAMTPGTWASLFWSDNFFRSSRVRFRRRFFFLRSRSDLALSPFLPDIIASFKSLMLLPDMQPNRLGQLHNNNCLCIRPKPINHTGSSPGRQCYSLHCHQSESFLFEWGFMTIPQHSVMCLSSLNPSSSRSCSLSITS